MPSVRFPGPYRFFFYSGDSAEPPHVHVERDNYKAKYWLDPVRLQRSKGFPGHELIKIQRFVEENREQFLRSWHEYFGN
jgi:hypothetical protein